MTILQGGGTAEVYAAVEYQAFLAVEPTGIKPVTSCLQSGRRA